MTDLELAVYRTVAQVLSIDTLDLKPSQDLFVDLNIDTKELNKVITQVNKDFRIHISIAESSRFKTVQDLTNLVDKLCQG